MRRADHGLDIVFARSNRPARASRIYRRSDSRRRNRPDRRRARAASSRMVLPANCGVLRADRDADRVPILDAAEIVETAGRDLAAGCARGWRDRRAAPSSRRVVALHPARQQVLQGIARGRIGILVAIDGDAAPRARLDRGRASRRRGPNCRGPRASYARPGHGRRPRAPTVIASSSASNTALASSRRWVK